MPPELKKATCKGRLFLFGMRYTTPYEFVIDQDGNFIYYNDRERGMFSLLKSIVDPCYENKLLYMIKLLTRKIINLIKGETIRYAISMILAVLLASNLFSQSVPDSIKRAIVRIETPEGLGTGLILRDSVLWESLFLVTNKHVVQSLKDSEYFDNVRIRINILKNGKIIAGQDTATIYLKKNNRKLHIKHLFIWCAGFFKIIIEI